MIVLIRGNYGMNNLVSIVMPLYNSEKYLEQTLNSVLDQTYSNWELIIVDDLSTDESVSIVQKYMTKDERIKLHKLELNSGAAVARTKAIELSKGKYIAFLDSDDIWYKEKLEKQISFMEENGYPFTCTDYEQIDGEGKLRNKIIKTKTKANYNKVLTSCPVGNLTVIYDVEKLGKFVVPNIRKRNDYALWLQILKKTPYIYGLHEVLAQYRVHSNSLSSSKFDLVKYHWYIYRKIEKLSVIRSLYHILIWGLIKIFRIK